MLEQDKYHHAIGQFNHAFGVPETSGILKQVPSNFVVVELLDIELSGEGEHVWLDIRKIQLSTERVAKALARYAGVAYRDVGYAGMKDVNAITRQWFSVWLPKKPDLDWSGFVMDGVEVEAICKHHRKLKRGAHQANSFTIRVTDIKGDIASLQSRAEKVKQYGVPNYFGEQRFGRYANNLNKAEAWFKQELRIKDRNLRSIVLSSARSYLFNSVVSARVGQGSWCELKAYEPAALEGGNSVFSSNHETDNAERLMALDIHPTAPLWGRGADTATQAFPELAEWESCIVQRHAVLASGLEDNKLDYARRSVRSVPQGLTLVCDDNAAVFEFTLQSGQFATSVIRELVSTAASPQSQHHH